MMNFSKDNLEFCIDWNLLFDADYSYPKNISFFQRWKLYKKRNNLIKELREYRIKNPYRCFTVKLIMENKV
jgi:hypothetical protein